MSSGEGTVLSRFRNSLRSVLLGPHVLAFLPALMLGGYWYGGEGLLLYMALLLPALFAIAGLFSGAGTSWPDDYDGTTGLNLRRAAVKRLDAALQSEAETGKSSAAIAVMLDDFRALERQFGTPAGDAILKQTGERLKTALRDGDTIVRLGAASFGVVLAPIRRIDLEAMLQLCARLQAAVADPYSIDATRVYATASVGFCTLARATTKTGAGVLDCAEVALNAAAANGPASIRAFTPEIKRRATVRAELVEEAAQALEQGQITAWFQPQLSTDTGAITGFEALARWEHPDKGIIPPSDFLPALQNHGLMERLGEVMLYQSLSALRDWDKEGQKIPAVSVNFSAHELRNPKLCEKIRWELDRFELTPDRLCVEILEDVIADSQDDVITRNIWALSELGCNIDLDDFGTGHASIANIRRFAVKRIKIDASFVARLDRDRDQQNMVAAVLTMAERLELDTLAEGVETVGEHAMLAQLGCGHVQGFSIARPMPLGEATDWITKYRNKLVDTPRVGRKAG
ncbi:MAG: bifunctional diguanylate cyclase/phosphodiesterase [Paracoccaceae bacterium]